MLADVLDGAVEEIARRWIERVQADIAGTDVELTLLRDGIPDYIRALAHSLRNGSSIPANGGSAWSKIAEKHGITRVRIGFDIDQLVHEFLVLRQILVETGRRHGVLEGHQGDLLADFLEAAIAHAVRAYVQTRDFEARRKEAEHIGFITHELRNPLTSAELAVSQLRRELPRAPKTDRIIELAERSHRRLAELITNTLAVERLEARQVQAHPRELRVGDLLDEIVARADRQADAKGLAFRANYDPELLLYADPELAASAIRNLIENAVKYTDTGGVDVDVTEGPGEVEIHVRDSCVGLSSEELATIFEPFKRGRTSKSGTGLGLAIARRAAEVQGGSIHVESTGQSGCHFWIALPRARH